MNNPWHAHLMNVYKNSNLTFRSAMRVASTTYKSSQFSNSVYDDGVEDEPEVVACNDKVAAFEVANAQGKFEGTIGVVAITPIVKGEIICEYYGDTYSLSDEKAKEQTMYDLLGGKGIINAKGFLPGFFNFSTFENANACMLILSHRHAHTKKNIKTPVIVAKETILPGREIRWDYDVGRGFTMSMFFKMRKQNVPLIELHSDSYKKTTYSVPNCLNEERKFEGTNMFPDFDKHLADLQELSNKRRLTKNWALALGLPPEKKPKKSKEEKGRKRSKG